MTQETNEQGALHTITWDNREQDPPADVRVQEMAALGVPAKVGQLEAGDIQWMVQFESGFRFMVGERKSVADFLSSVRDGRLNRFLDLTGGLEPHPSTVRFLLLEGNQFAYTDFSDRPMGWTALDNALMSLQLLGVMIVRSPDTKQTAARIKALWEYSAREEHTTFLRTVRPHLTGKYLNPLRKDAVRAIMCLPGFGELTAKRTLDHFGSVQAVLEAIQARDHKAFKGVERVGKGMVNNAADFMEVKFNG